LDFLDQKSLAFLGFDDRRTLNTKKFNKIKNLNNNPIDNNNLFQTVKLLKDIILLPVGGLCREASTLLQAQTCFRRGEALEAALVAVFGLAFGVEALPHRIDVFENP